MCHEEFPDVNYLDYEGKFARTPVQLSSIPFYWSNHPSGVSQDYVPKSYAQADYIINMANFKSHTIENLGIYPEALFSHQLLTAEFE